jgi:hypothetical protein
MKYKIVFIDNNLEKAFKKLDDLDPIKKALVRAIKNIQEDPRAGRNVIKKMIPKSLIKKYDIENLRIYNLPNAWRMLYTLTSDGVEIISVVLDWRNHKDYERLFKF